MGLVLGESRDVMTIGVVLKRTRVTCHVEARPQIIARHRAHAAAMGHDDLDGYFREMVGEERLEDALDFVANPWFGALTKVEFAQELFEVALQDLRPMPWGPDPCDMTEDAFVEAISDWAYAEWESVAHVDLATTAARYALTGDGKALRETVAPLVAHLESKAAYEAEENDE